MRFSVSRRADPTIDVTPMIDVVFQLLIFFMVTTTFITSQGIQVDLPRSSAQVVLSEKKDLNVLITQDGAVYLDDVAVTSDGLASALQRRAKVEPNAQVVIKADQGVSHGRVVAVMDLARSHGLTRLAIATEVADEP